MIHNFHKLAKITLVLVYLVIVAGAVVRMTGSGMGCPDWPKCFGYYIPPTEEATLQWQAGRAFEKGQVIIVEQALKVAKEDFTTGTSFDPQNWEAYTKHDYATFNVWHTWVEYINRLLGALAGLATLALALFSFRFLKTDRLRVLLSCLVVIGMGFQAWLGATVVYSVLAPYKITLHMLMALVIVALLLIVIKRSAPKVLETERPPSRWFGLVLVIALVLSLVQIVLGTQVREFIDLQIKTLGEASKSDWLAAPTMTFYVHRTFSILVLLLNLYLFVHVRRYALPFKKMNAVMLLLGLEIATGILMYYVDFPFGSQPLHLVLASILFGVQYYLILEYRDLSVATKSS
ncbi:COX15/CtaA family protein [Flagellimonas sp. DF-77]|uniref:COX15/CtaA family protein n=1 Tax=Flagellimonas algarum TaxID=3230298 RepID=UPI00339125C8